MTRRTLGSDVENVTARTTFERLAGGFYLVQRFEADSLLQYLNQIGDTAQIQRLVVARELGGRAS